MRALRVIVVVMGVMILAGFAALFIAIAGRIAQPRSAAPSIATVAAAPIELPAGARVESIGVGTDRLAVAIALPNGDRQIAIIDIATGRRLQLVPLRTAP